MTARHRILFLNDTARNGGPGRSLHTLLRALGDGSFHRTVVLPAEGEVSELLRADGAADELFTEAALVENPVAPLGRPMERGDHQARLWLKAVRLVANALRVVRGVWRLAGRARRGRFDLIYCNGTTANFFGAFAGLLARVPVLWHVRYTSLPDAVRRLHDWLARGRTVKRIVCVSQAAATLFPGQAAGKVAVVPNGVDLTRWTVRQGEGLLRQELGIDPEVVIVGSHGRVLRRKGYLELLAAAAVLLPRLSAADRERCRFVVVGDTPADFAEDHLEVCRQRAKVLGIADHVSFIGFRADVRPYVADFDVAVVPSIYADPLPRAVLESMALGKPVVAFSVGGVPEMLRHGVEGTLIAADPPDVFAMATALEGYRRDPARRARHGAAARSRVERDFDAGAHAIRVATEMRRALAPR